MGSIGSTVLFVGSLLTPSALAWGLGYAAFRQRRLFRLSVSIGILVVGLIAIPYLLVLWPIALLVWPTELALLELFVVEKAAK